MKDITEYPISAIRDGWVLKDGRLYLFVRTDAGVQKTVIIDRPDHVY